MSTESEENPLFDPLLDDGNGGREKSGFVPEFLRKLAVAGLGAVFMTEEGVRNLAGQLKLPKEVLGYLLAQAEKTKDDVSRTVSEELRRFMQSDKLRQEFIKLLAGTSVEVTAQIRLVPSKSSKKTSAAEPPGTAHAEDLEESLKDGTAVPEISVTELRTRRHKKKD